MPLKNAIICLKKLNMKIIMYSDHKNLHYFMTICVLNWCQAWWALSLFWFQFVITYCFRCQQGKLDVLSRCLYLMFKEGHFQTWTSSTLNFIGNSWWHNPSLSIREDLKKYPLAIGIQSQLNSHHQVQDFSNDHVKFKFQDGLFYCDGILYVLEGPAQFQVL